MTKFIYTFGDGKAEGSAAMKELLGGKGAGLAEMSLLGLPVPPGFTLTTEVCSHYYSHNEQYPPELEAKVAEAFQHIETTLKGPKFGDAANPLLVSVRSGARASMPGMMDTVLNLGLNENTLKGLAEKSKNIEFAKESFKRLQQMFQNVVGKPLPHDPHEQLWEAIGAVFKSWNSERAVEYRRIHRIPADWGTACNVQAMVFGNMGDDSGTGVAFTRDPSTGERKFFGEYLINAQGEDVVAGVRTPLPLDEMKKTLPQCYQQLVDIYQNLEKHYRDMQDMEFTIQHGKVWMLQTRRGKRTAKAAIKIAVDMVSEGLIGKEEAVLRIEPSQIDQLLHPMISPRVRRKILAKGLPASPGAAVGRVVFSAEEAVVWAEKKEPVILVRTETSAEDIKGMHVAEGILTARGGMTSHAAVVGRGMGKVCVVGCGAIEVDESKKQFSVDNAVVKEGDWITLDGTRGEVMLGQLPTVASELSKEFQTLMIWADGYRKMKVRANADTPQDAKRAREFGAEGIGLCRTEHMFFDADRIQVMRQMIVAESLEERKKALAKLKPMQKKDFSGIFQEMKGLPVTIRLLDPPLHEFLPQTPEDIEKLGCEMKVPAEKLKNLVEDLHEANPMLGHRGCRLGITYPEIYEMQIEAIMEAACELKNQGVEVIPEIELPLISLAGEIKILRQLCEEVCARVQKVAGVTVSFKIGTMVETPRAAFRADAIAPFADFFSFGTNDLTQTTMGISRDDGFKFLPLYELKGLLRCDPFQTIDFEGVGELMKVCVQKTRQIKPDMEIGICGEHGGDPESVIFCHEIGLNYVSCSPFRVPIARLAAAQAALLDKAQNQNQDRSFH
ncbi:MAG: pyruvate, phosphate dikinase [Deltaproteobacteria bacterium]|nr:pyruvate, phosphate dikinase [Deltaproteobacteria bacterium]